MSLPPFGGASRLQEAVRLLQQGNAAGAVTLLETEIRENPKNGIAFQYLGVARSQGGDIGGGILALREAVRLTPQDANVHYNLGIALAQARQTEEAKAVLQKSLALDPGNTLVRTALEKLGCVPAGAIFVPTPGPAEIVRDINGKLDFGGIMPQFAPPAPPPPAPSAPVLREVGGMPGLSAVGGGHYQAALSLTPESPPALSANGSPAGEAAGGGLYSPPPSYSRGVMGREPTAGERIGRGIGWGALCGQWWTFCIMLSALVFDGILSGGRSGGYLLFVTIIFALIFAVVGGITGLIIGAMDADDEGGAIIGIGAGILCFLVKTAFDIFYLHHPHLGIFINAGSWVISGRFIGSVIGNRVQVRLDD